MIGDISVLIDTGCALNLIKEKHVRKGTNINSEKRYSLVGIGNGMVKTLGEVILEFDGRKTEFQLVPNEFPVENDGIIGVNFLESEQAQLIFRRNGSGEMRIDSSSFPFLRNTTISLPPRSRKIIEIPVNTSNLAEGILPRIDVGPDVYLGEALVKPVGGYVRVCAINSSSEAVTATFPIPDLEENPLDTNQQTDIEPSLPDKREEAKRVATLLRLIRLDHLNQEEKNKLVKVISRYSYQFYLPGDKLQATDVFTHRIELTDSAPVYIRQYRHAHVQKEELNRQIQEMVRDGIIQASISPYNAPCFLVPKKIDSSGKQKWRLVIDYRALNEKVVNVCHPLPNITDILDQLGKSVYFSTMDLASGFYQIPLEPSSRPLTAFSTPFGHWEFLRTPMGLRTSSSVFQKMMNKICSGLQGVEMLVYMDDAILYSQTLDEHIGKLGRFLDKMKSAKLTLKPEKCSFLCKEITYLGHVVSSKGVSPDPRKVEAVKEFPVPVNKKNVKQFLGLVGYYRRFIKDLAKIARPLYKLLKKEVRFEWTADQQQAFETLTNILSTPPLLQHPDFKSEFIITCDASDYAAGAVLSQGSIGKDPPIAYASRLFGKAEKNYSTSEKELLAMIFGVEQFRPYIYGTRFTLVTDHRPLV